MALLKHRLRIGVAATLSVLAYDSVAALGLRNDHRPKRAK